VSVNDKDSELGAEIARSLESTRKTIGEGQTERRGVKETATESEEKLQ